MSTIPAPRRRRWIRFSVRSILLLMVLVAIPLAWTFNKVRAQRRTVAAIENAGGTVHYYGPMYGYGPTWVRYVLGDEFFSSVTGMTIEGTPLTTDDVRGVLLALPSLSHVCIKGDVTDAVVEPLAGLKRLTDLKLASPLLTDDALDRIRGCAKLKRLTLAGSFSAAGVARFEPPSNIHELVITSPGVNEESITLLANCRHMDRLKVRGNDLEFSSVHGLEVAASGLSDVGLAHITRAHSITTLNIEGMFTDAGVAHVALLGNLTRLWMDSPKITDVGLQHLKHSTQLSVLDIDGNMSDTGLAYLSELSNLKSLGLTGTFTDSGVAHLAKAIHLKELVLSSPLLTDDLVRFLPKCQELEGLYMQSDALSQVGAARLHQMFPKCRVRCTGSDGTVRFER